MNGWTQRNIGSLVESVSDTFKFTDDPVVFLNTSDILAGKFLHANKSDPKTLPGQAKKRIKKGDLLFSEIRPANKRYALVKFDADNYVVSTKLMVLRSKGEIDTEYLRLFLTSDENLKYLQMIAEDRSGTFPQITFDNLAQMEIFLPDPNEQKSIASVLSSLDDKIDILHRQNKTLEAMAESLFRQWFVEGAGDWEEGKLGNEFDFTMGQSPPGSSFNEEGIGMPMFQGNADFGFRFPEKRVYTTEPTRFALPMDTLISVRAPVGAQNMANEECCIGRGVAAFRYKFNNDFYTYTYFKLRSLMHEITKFNDEGTVFGSISKSDFEGIISPVPPVALVEKFETEAKPINDRVISNCKQIKLLEKLRDSLLPKLISGEVRVAHA